MSSSGRRHVRELVYDMYRSYSCIAPVKDGLPHGFGEILFYNGDQYQGSLVKGKFHGFGRYTWGHGDEYCGEFVSNVREGQGTFRSSHDGSTYRGTWAKGEKHGKGILFDPERWTRHEGTWKEGQKDGKFLVTKGFRSFIEEWKNNVLVKTDEFRHQYVQTCLICYNASVNCVFLNCGHVCACLTCAQQITKCPMCRKPFEVCRKVFFTGIVEDSFKV